MRWIFALLPFHLCTCGVFSDESNSTFRETIAQYGYTDKDSDHSYIEAYEKLLAPFKNKPCNLLELGVNFGGSAIMWYNHLPKSQLFLVDNRNVLRPHITSSMHPDRWNLYVEDAYTLDMVAKMQQACPDGFDIIIDDGPHSAESQQFVITSYLSLLKEGGVLIIEDIQYVDILDFLKSYVPNSSEFQVEVIDLRNVKGRYDDILFVVKRVSS
jgi:cephalosporin hydroxylase